MQEIRMSDKRVLLILLILTLTNSCTSNQNGSNTSNTSNQNNAGAVATNNPNSLPESFTKDFEGTVDKEYPTWLHVKKNGNQLFIGFAYGTDENPISLNGSIDAENKFVVQGIERENNNTPVVLKGKFISSTEIVASHEPNTPADLAHPIHVREKGKGQSLIPKPYVENDLSPQDEAISEIKKMFEKIYAKCGDSYYRKADSQNPNFVEFWQWKDVTFQAAPSQLSETNKLNKIEWAGQVYIGAKFRRYCIGRRWENYQEGGIMKLNALKAKGQWQLDTDFLSANRGWGPPTCAEIPKD